MIDILKLNRNVQTKNIVKIEIEHFDSQPMNSIVYSNIISKVELNTNFYFKRNS